MRLPREWYFMDMAKLVSERSTCVRRHVGAIAVKNDHIIATGYNGAPVGQPHCLDIGCLRAQLNIPSGEKHELCRGVHAEQNVICHAAYHGVEIFGATLYCTTQPCSICAKMIVNAGIDKVVYLDGYPDHMTMEILFGKLEKMEKQK